VSDERFSCARAALERNEPLHGTASTVRRWLIVEQPGPWGADAVSGSRLPERTADGLRDRARDANARLILIRRHGREDPDAQGHTCFVAYTGPDRSWVERFDLDRPAEIMNLDLAPLRDGESVDGRPVADPLYLVCTNGSHDPCCAEFGRPLAATLERLRPEGTWECSHIGGDRFAGNLVVFPQGLYFGRVNPDDAPGVVESYEEGRIDLDFFRGRSAYPFHVQAAEHLIRTGRGIDGIEALRFVRREPIAQNLVDVTFADTAGTVFVARVTVEPEPDGQLLTCHAAGRSCPPRYELVDLEVRPA
jgi:hypothetical protein